ncbi:hypothetical protein HPB50_004969 [Hyalomma asiaticum]|uniref:Uncharacterized protein n=1 Tax=Hyalomma asiaticum TaxID=266040 RepID=A0ACB7TCN1_HYAAI|nr:hypothetical protein HPB50_004969 [Hyalomma asiaticum]
MEENASSVDEDFERLNRTTTFAEFVEADDDVAICGELSLDDAIAEALPDADTTATSDEDEDDAAAAADAVPTSFADMLRHIDGIRSYVCTREATEDVLLDVAKLEGKLLRLGSKKVQKKLTDFFKLFQRALSVERQDTGGRRGRSKRTHSSEQRWSRSGPSSSPFASRVHPRRPRQLPAEAQMPTRSAKKRALTAPDEGEGDLEQFKSEIRNSKEDRESIQSLQGAVMTLVEAVAALTGRVNTIETTVGLGE